MPNALHTRSTQILGCVRKTTAAQSVLVVHAWPHLIPSLTYICLMACINAHVLDQLSIMCYLCACKLPCHRWQTPTPLATTSGWRDDLFASFANFQNIWHERKRFFVSSSISHGFFQRYDDANNRLINWVHVNAISFVNIARLLDTYDVLAWAVTHTNSMVRSQNIRFPSLSPNIQLNIPD